ncbi:MAG TPA: glucose 1-dehydrogenase [Vicinamibacteria bacterium]|nr:glucose 1-dehydrogenase [Vicinamibacteria bacterium]
MRAVAVVPGRREVRLLATPEPRLQSPTDVRIRILEVGVCGTDKEICAFEYGLPPAGSDHLIIGHESLGEVVEVGGGVTAVRPGDLVVVMVRRPCARAECVPCRSGRPDFCSTGEFVERGISGVHGFMTEYVVEDERWLVPVPRSLREVAVLVEPLTIAEKAVIQVGQIQSWLPWSCASHGESFCRLCHNAVVLGAGPVGLLGAMALASQGFRTFVYSREAEGGAKDALVRSFGARYVSTETTPPAGLPERVGGIDLVYEAVGLSRLAFDVMAQMGRNGVFLFTGVAALRGPQPLDTDTLMRNLVLKNQVALGTVNAGRDAFEAAVRDLGVFVERWPQAIRQVITGRYPIDAYRDLLLGRPGGIKNLIALAS